MSHENLINRQGITSESSHVLLKDREDVSFWSPGQRFDCVPFVAETILSLCRADVARLVELIAFLIHPPRVSARAGRPFKRLQPLEEFAAER